MLLRSLHTIVLYGDNFGGPPPTITGTPGAVTDALNVIRYVEYGNKASPNASITWANAATNAGECPLGFLFVQVVLELHFPRVVY